MLCYHYGSFPFFFFVSCYHNGDQEEVVMYFMYVWSIFFSFVLVFLLFCLLGLLVSIIVVRSVISQLPIWMSCFHNLHDSLFIVCQTSIYVIVVFFFIVLLFFFTERPWYRHGGTEFFFRLSQFIILRFVIVLKFFFCCCKSTVKKKLSVCLSWFPLFRVLVLAFHYMFVVVGFYFLRVWSFVTVIVLVVMSQPALRANGFDARKCICLSHPTRHDSTRPLRLS